MNGGDKSRTTTLITPCLDFSLLLVMILFSTAGLGWLTRCPLASQGVSNTRIPTADELERDLADTQHLIEELTTRRVTLIAGSDDLTTQLECGRASRADAQAIQAEVERVSRELAQLESERKRLAVHLQELVNANTTSERECQQLQHERQQVEQQLTELRQKLEELRQKQRDLQEEQERIEQLRPQLADIEKQLQDVTKTNQTLREEIAKNAKPVVPKTIRIDTQPRFQPDTEREVCMVLLNEGTVTPVREPYYTVTRGSDGTVTAQLARRGSTAAKALAENSYFINLLQEVRSRHGYVYLLVDTESFETFRAVRAELRRRQIDCGWEPTNYANISLVATGGRDPGTQ